MLQKKQSDRLANVKKTTLIVVIVADSILLGALAYQIIWLNESLHGALSDRITDLTGFYQFHYREQLTHLALGANLYSLNSSSTDACRALVGDPKAKSENQQRLSNDAQSRSIEIAIITDVTGLIVSSAGPISTLGNIFNPQQIVTNFNRHYPHTTDQLQCSVMTPVSMFETIKSPVFDVNGEYHPELRSWYNYTETLTRLTLTPLYCGTPNIHGYLIMGDAMYPRQYNTMNRLVSVSGSALVTVLTRTSDLSWQMQYSYNKPGDTGWTQQFPDLLPYFTSDSLNHLYTQGTVQAGRVSLGGVQYSYGAIPIQKQNLGSATTDLIPDTIGVVVYAEPEFAIKRTVNTALLWHVPFGVFMTVLSFIMLQFTYVKFLNPMSLLIQSVKKKKMKEFSDRIRQLKSNRGTIWALLLKTLFIQSILLGLIFVNRYLLQSTIQDFTSATIQGRIGPFLVASHTRSIASYLNAWTFFSSMITTASTRNVTSSFRADFNDRFGDMTSDAMYLIGLDSIVMASTYQAAEGLVFPEIGIMEYYKNQTDAELSTFTSMTSWHPANVNRFTPRKTSLTEAPAFIQLAVAPVNYVTFDATDDRFIMGDLVGALIVIRIFNGLHSIWDNVVQSFGLYEWDRYNKRFASVSSLLKTSDSVDYTVGISTSYYNLLLNGVLTTYQDDGELVQEGVYIQGQSDTLCISPFSSSDDVILSPLMMNFYQATGVPQDRYNRMLAQQLGIQSAIMAVEWLASMIALFCTYWPVKKFLDSLEKAFNVGSMSNEKRHKMEERAAAMLETARP